jgi:hypothetical protein
MQRSEKIVDLFSTLCVVLASTLTAQQRKPLALELIRPDETF